MIFVAISPQNIPPFDPCAPHIVDTKHSKHDAPGTTIPDTHGGTLETGRTFLFRTGQLGRDIFSRVVYGARISPYVSLISVGVGATMGGVVSSYFGSKFDLVVSAQWTPCKHFQPLSSSCNNKRRRPLALA